MVRTERKPNMTQTDNETTASSVSRTKITAALVCETDLRTWDQVKAAAESLGARILFQKAAPPWMQLWIEEREREPSTGGEERGRR